MSELVYNKAFSILTRGVGEIRRAVPGLYKADDSVSAVHDALVPAGLGEYTDFAAEQLIACVRSSYVADAFAAFDPANSYRHSIEFPTFFNSSVEGGESLEIKIQYRPEADVPRTLKDAAGFEVDPASSTVFFLEGPRKGESQQYTQTDGLSEPVRLTDSVYMTFTGTEAGSAVVRWELPFTRSLLDVYRRLPASAGHKYEYLDSMLLPDYIAGIVLDVCLKEENSPDDS